VSNNITHYYEGILILTIFNYVLMLIKGHFKSEQHGGKNFSQHMIIIHVKLIKYIHIFIEYLNILIVIFKFVD